MLPRGGCSEGSWLPSEICGVEALATLVSEGLGARPLQRCWSSGWGEGPWPSLAKGEPSAWCLLGPQLSLPGTQQAWFRSLWNFKSGYYSTCCPPKSTPVSLEPGFNRRLSEATMGVRGEARREASPPAGCAPPPCKQEIPFAWPNLGSKSWASALCPPSQHAQRRGCRPYPVSLLLRSSCPTAAGRCEPSSPRRKRRRGHQHHIRF